jgi:hypothetical protein
MLTMKARCVPRSARTPRAFARHDASWLFAIVGTYLTIALSLPAHAAKWQSCPAPPIPVYPSVQGATTAPFIHPGHDLTIVLNSAEMASTGGFSLAPEGGNVVAIEFHSLFGQPIDLAPRMATAYVSNTLIFTFPDTEVEVKEPLAGPVDVQVTTVAGTQVAHISWTDLVALPPTNDVTPLVLGEDSDAVILSALSADGDLWVPAHFQGDPMVMPSCPGNFIVPVPVQVAAAEVVGADPSVPNPLAHISGLDGYLGDLAIFGNNFYGMLLPIPIKLVHVAGTLGVSLCQLNDAVDVVLRVHGAAAWANSNASAFKSVAIDSTPIPLRMIAARFNPSANPTTQDDSFGAECLGQGSGRK